MSKNFKFANAYIQFVYRNKWKLFFLILLIFIMSLIPIIFKLKINPDLATLLPKDTPSVLALEESYDRFGSTDRFMIAIQSSDPYLVAEIQDSVKAYIAKNWKDEIITEPQVDNDNSFFIKNALLYLPVEHLERIRDNLETIQFEIGREHGPLVVDLLEDSNVQKKEKKELVWFDANLPQALGLPDEAADAFSTFFETPSKEEQNTKITSNEPEDLRRKVPKALDTRLMGVDKDTPDLFNGIVQCKLTRPSTDIDFVEHILAKADTLLKHYSSKTYSSPVLMTVEGSYEGLSEVDDLMNDSTISLIISLFLIYFIVAWFFKSIIRAPILMLAQVSLACALSMCFTAFYYGALNPFTVLVASIILGMGIDYSIHFLGTCQRHFTESGDLKDALTHTIANLLRPMFLAALTTIAGLISLLTAKFVGFYEFGVISAVGIFFSFLTAIFAMPVFILIAKGLPPRPRASFFPASWDDAKVARFFKRAIMVGGIFTIVSICFFPYLEFEHNFKNLRRPPKEKNEVRKKIATGVAIASNRKTSTPAAVMGDTPEQLDSLYDSLMVILHKEKDPTLRSFLTLKTFLPSQADQEERMEIIEEISDLADARVFDRATGKDSANIATLRGLVKDVSIFTLDSLPEWALDLLKEKDGSIGKIGFIYGKYHSWDALEAAKWQDKFGHWNFGGKNLKVFSSQFILSDVIRAVKADAVKMAIVVLLVVILILVFSLRNIRQVIVASTALIIGLIWSMGLLGFINFTIGLGHIGIYNVVVIPAILGLAIDSSIHLISSWTQNPDMTPRKLLDTTGRLVMASSITTIAGFAGALGISHKGLRTIGELAVSSISMFLLAAIIFTITLSFMLLKKEK